MALKLTGTWVTCRDNWAFMRQWESPITSCAVSGEGEDPGASPEALAACAQRDAHIADPPAVTGQRRAEKSNARWAPDVHSFIEEALCEPGALLGAKVEAGSKGQRAGRQEQQRPGPLVV